MANSDKNILITPNIGSASADPKIVFSGASASVGPQNITLQVYPTNSGTLSFEGSAGQLFSITNSMTGTIYSVNDVSGIPSIEVLDTGLVKLAQYSGNVLLGSGTDDGSKLQVKGSTRSGNNGWNSSPASTVFSHTLSANAGTNRVLNFDGNGLLPSVWWTNGSRALGAIDAQDPGLTFWANDGSNWQKQISLGYGTVSIDTVLQQAGNQVLHAGNYTSYSPSLTGGSASGTWGISITGSAGSAPANGGTATALDSGNYISRTGSSGNLDDDFRATPAGTQRYQGDDSGLTNSPGATWWIYEHKRHSNATNYWGTQIAWGWEDNANRLAQRNVTGNVFSGWVYYLNSGNYNSYAPTLTGTGASGTWGISISGNAATASNGGVTSVNGQTGAVTISAGGGGAAFGKTLVFAR